MGLLEEVNLEEFVDSLEEVDLEECVDSLEKQLFGELWASPLEEVNRGDFLDPP